MENITNLKIADIAKDFYEKDEKTNELKKLYEDAKAERDAASELLIAKMIEQEQTEVVVDGVPKRFALKNTLYASYTVDNRDAVFSAFRSLDYDSIIKEEIHPKRLNSIITELTDNGQIDLPDELNGLINTFIKPTISITRRG